MIDYRVKTFLALCDFMNYRKTAQILNMTQPAVTQHIHFLENQYGCKLFDYDRHSLKMTREGMLLKRYCESVMYQEEKLFEKIKSGEKRLVRFGATKTIGEYVIPEQVERFLQLPDYNVEIEIDNTRYLQIPCVVNLNFNIVIGQLQKSFHLFRDNIFSDCLCRTKPHKSFFTRLNLFKQLFFLIHNRLTISFKQHSLSRHF